MHLNPDFSHTFVGSFSETDWQEQIEKMNSIHTAFQESKAQQQPAFTALPYQNEQDLAPLLALAQEVRSQFKSVLIVGIGGSDLGARAVHRALNHQFYNFSATRGDSPQLFFVGDTTDPVALHEVLSMVDLKVTAVVIISKSGDTMEQTSVFLLLREQLIEAVGMEQVNRHIIVLTDAEKGTLRTLVEQEKYRSLPIPQGVGGRFSVLSSVGLFPLALVGVDIKQLLAGAQAVDEADKSERNPIIAFAAAQYLAYTHGYTTTVFMPYVYSLREVGFWFRQLWAESLGKKEHSHSEEKSVGPTPIAALGPTDQHSQLQLYMQGPADKIITFVTAKKLKSDFIVPKAFPEIEQVAYLAEHNFQSLLAAEQQSSAQALADVGRPSCVLELPEVNAENLGELLYFLELATAYMGELLDINTFDQPGVELSKQHMYHLLGKPGY